MPSILDKIRQSIDGASAPSGQHVAAILNKAGTPLEITLRKTPTPGPNELLIEVNSVALNPIDYYQRDFGFAISKFPAVVGSDVAGTVVSAGSSVSSSSPKPGDRVAAFAPCFFKQGDPNYGALQAYVLVPAGNAVPLPETMSFNEASLLPMAVATAWAGYYSIGVARDTAYTKADKKGVLIWGGASSIGSAAIQIAKSMGFMTYVTASATHHEYLKTLGANKLFDYKDSAVTGKIVAAAKEDGVALSTGFDAVGQVQPCLDILKEFAPAKLATSKHPTPETPSAEGVEVKFMEAPDDEEAQLEHFHFIFAVWLKGKLAKGEFVPSPHVKVVGSGLEAVNGALDELKKGVSGVKLVLDI